MASLGLFLLLLVPIRIPTLSLTTGEEADFNKEIKAHGIANLVSGLGGSVHNYLRCVAVCTVHCALVITAMTSL
jgi:MFS superfamily sulfate permease-like transporter